VRWIATIVAVTAVCCAKQERSWSYDEHLGVAVRRPGQACLSIADRSLGPGTELRVVATDPPGGVWKARTGKANKACVPDPAANAGLAGYDIVFDGDAPPESLPLIAVVSQSLQLHTSAGAAAADLDGDQHDEFLRSCASNEGLHFTAWSTAPLTGQRRWHRYYYLGYDIEPTCTANEVR
jgi:hypothetical protein